MSVIFIGSKRVGKTRLLVELANQPNNPNDSFVRVLEPSYEELRSDFYAEDVQKAEENEDKRYEPAATEGIETRDFRISVNLGNREKFLKAECVDCSGEIWKYDNDDDSKKMKIFDGKVQQDLIRNLRMAKGIILVLAPPKGKLFSHLLKQEGISKKEKRFLEDLDWIQEFENILLFLSKNTTNTQHILICLNMADLFCEDFNAEGEKLRYVINPSYHTNSKPMDWLQRYKYILNKYFDIVKPLIERYNITNDGNGLQVFITTYKNRRLLELPWLYLANYLPEEKK